MRRYSDAWVELKLPGTWARAALVLAILSAVTIAWMRPRGGPEQRDADACRVEPGARRVSPNATRIESIAYLLSGDDSTRRSSVEPVERPIELPSGDAVVRRGKSPDGVEVVIVDSGGISIQGIDVQLRRRPQGDDVDPRVEQVRTCARGTTDVSGRAWLREDDAERANRERLADVLGAEFEFSVDVLVPLPDPPTRMLSAELGLAEPVRIALPPHGGLRIRLARPGGDVRPNTCRVSYGSRPVGLLKHFQPWHEHDQPLVDGVGRTEVVALGPTKVGEVVEIEVVLGKRMPVVRGGLVPAGSDELRISVDPPNPSCFISTPVEDLSGTWRTNAGYTGTLTLREGR